MSERRSSYGWVVVGVSATANSLAWSVRSTFAVFYVALLDEFHWRRADAALGYSLSWLLLLVFSPLGGRLSDRWGARVLVPLGGLSLGAGLLLSGHVSSLWHYYLAFGVLGAAGIGFIQTPAFAIVNGWFSRSRGAALGIVSAGASASAVIFYPINTWLIVTYGWRTAFAVFALIVAGITVPLAALLYRNAPAEPAAAPARVDSAPADDEWTLRRALRSGPFWSVFAMWGLGVIGYQIMATHQVAHGIKHGFDPVALGWYFALGGATTVVGNLVGGAISDRWGREIVFALGTVIAVAGIGAFAAIDGPHDHVLLLLYAASGFGFGMRISLLAAIPSDIFAGRNLGAILGAAHGGGGLGGFIGPYLGGWIFDVTGSYNVAFAAAAVTVGGSAVAAWLAAPRRARAARRAAGPAPSDAA
jgi:MFS family permease